MINDLSEFKKSIKMPNEQGKQLNYLIVIPFFVEDFTMQYLFPYGICMVSSALKASGRTVFTLNLNYKRDYSAVLKKFVTDNQIDVVMTGALSSGYLSVKAILDTVKGVERERDGSPLPEIITIVGGGLITADPIVAMNALVNADYGVIGEGEIAINELCYALENDLSTDKIKGVIRRGDTTFEPAQIIENLDILPPADYDSFEYDVMLSKKYNPSYADFPKNARVANIYASRSCPFNCTFCVRLCGEKYRKRSIDKVFEDIDYQVEKYKINFILFEDELFISNKKDAIEFCARLKPYNIKWWGQSRVNVVTEDMLQLMKDSGCILLTFGVESGDESILVSMQKKITVKQIEQAFMAAKKVGMPATGNIIFGDLNETPETIQNSLDFWWSHPEFRNDIYLRYIIVFPGSFLYKEACRKGIIADPVQYLKDGCPPVNLTKMSDEEWARQKEKIELYCYANDLGLEKPALDLAVCRNNVQKLTDNSKAVAYWPVVNQNANVIMKTLPDGDNRDIYFLNADTTGRSHLISGIDEVIAPKKLVNPDVIVEKGIDTIVVPYRFSMFKKIQDICKEQYPCVERVIHIGELFDEQFLVL